MQEQPLQPHLLFQALVGFLVAVLVVAGDRVAQVGGMHADLVGAAGLDPDFAEAVATAAFEHLKWLTEGLPEGSTRTRRSPPCSTDFSSGASTVRVPLGTRPTSSARYFLPGPSSSSPPRISACSSSRAERFLATRITPEVSRSSRCTSSSGSPGRSARRDLDQAMADAAAAVGGQAARFVHGQQGLVLEEDAGGQSVEQALGGGRTSPGSFSFTGGRRTSSPPARRLSGLARLPLMRTWPLRTSL